MLLRTKFDGHDVQFGKKLLQESQQQVLSFLGPEEEFEVAVDHQIDIGPEPALPGLFNVSAWHLGHEIFHSLYGLRFRFFCETKDRIRMQQAL